MRGHVELAALIRRQPVEYKEAVVAAPIESAFPATMVVVGCCQRGETTCTKRRCLFERHVTYRFGALAILDDDNGIVMELFRCAQTAAVHQKDPAAGLVPKDCTAVTVTAPGCSQTAHGEVRIIRRQS